MAEALQPTCGAPADQRDAARDDQHTVQPVVRDGRAALGSRQAEVLVVVEQENGAERDHSDPNTNADRFRRDFHVS